MMMMLMMMLMVGVREQRASVDRRLVSESVRARRRDVQTDRQASSA